MIRIASFNVENLFARAKAMNLSDWELGRPILEAHREVNTIMQEAEYPAVRKERMKQLLEQLDIYSRNQQGALRRRETQDPRWAWLRKNRGSFDRQPQDETADVEIIAEGRASWIGWVELAKESVDEVGTRMTARVIREVNADILCVVEAEDRPALVRFNRDMLNGQYAQVLLVDGNDDRGIDLGIMVAPGYAIQSIRSNVYATDNQGEIFSRDCPQYEIETPNGTRLHLLLNHFKSQSGGGGQKRARQAAEVRRIVDRLVAANERVVVLGDLNEGPAMGTTQAENLAALYNGASPLIDCYSFPAFATGARPGTFDSCALRNRLDYVFVSQSLGGNFHSGEIFRKGLWGTRQTRPTDWDTYAEMQNGDQQASDHAAVYINLNL
jgi:endonuclease/exonuclease/phosphatase family metal-dependent hydrolase